MDNKYDDQLLIMKNMIESNRKDSCKKTKKLTEDITVIITPIMNHIQIMKSSPDNMDSPKYQDPATVVPAIKKAPPLVGGHSEKNGGVWTLKHDTSSPKFYKLLINT